MLKNATQLLLDTRKHVQYMPSIAHMAIRESAIKILRAVLETILQIIPLVYVLIVIIFHNIACPLSEATFGNPLTKYCVR